MNQLLQNFVEHLAKASLASKVTAALVILALAATGVIAGVLSSKPHFEMLYSGLNAQEAADVQRALGEGDIRYEVSQPPGPFSIYVDDGKRYVAQNLVAISGALDRAPSGIPGGEGLSTVFMSAGERSQMVRKREWEETEGMLEELDFVKKARVRSSAPKGSPFGRREPVTASVTLQLGGGVLDKEQAASVSNLVRFGLGVERENLVITDQNGRAIFDGASELEVDDGMAEWIEFQELHDRGLEDRVNAVLAESFGDGRTRITVHSQWDFDKVATHSERTENTKALVSDVKRTSKTPQGSSITPDAGGPAGTASNLAQGSFGIDSAGVVGRDSASSSGVATDLFAETEDKRTEYVPSWTTTETRRTTPLLERISVSLFVEDSLDADRAQLEEVVKAAVGFDERRGDQLRSMPIAKIEVADEGEATTTEGAEEVPVEEGGRNPLLEKLIETAVEVAAALAFVFLLFKSLRGSGGGGEATSADAAAQADDIDPELLARAKVDEMLIEDPERVGEILSEWAREEIGARG